MKQRKSLDLTSKLSLEALISDTGTELSFKFGKKEFRVTSEEIRQLRDWLTKEVLNEMPGVVIPIATQPKIDLPTTVPAPVAQPMAGGPVILDPKGKPIGADPLENRRASVTSAPKYGAIAKDLTGAQGLLKDPKDQFQAHNLSMGIASGVAKEAFGPEQIFDGGPGNK